MQTKIINSQSLLNFENGVQSDASKHRLPSQSQR